jgi:TatA/E family protein of Tat protein translocase
MVDFTEILLIVIVALLLFGPDKLPEYLKQLGRFYAEIKKAQRDFERELSKESVISNNVLEEKKPSDKVIGIAQKMGISTEGKTESQILDEIGSAVAIAGDKK